MEIQIEKADREELTWRKKRLRRGRWRGWRRRVWGTTNRAQDSWSVLEPFREIKNRIWENRNQNRNWKWEERRKRKLNYHERMQRLQHWILHVPKCRCRVHTPSLLLTLYFSVSVSHLTLHFHQAQLNISILYGPIIQAQTPISGYKLTQGVLLFPPPIWGLQII